MADLNKTLTKACSYRGADMGRTGTSDNPQAKVNLFRVRLDQGGYDQGGAYWGIGNPLYCARGEYFEKYLRACDRNDAKAKLLKDFPKLKFYR